MWRRIVLYLLSVSAFARTEFFQPSHRLTGIGTARSEMTATLLEERTRLMIEAQTFGILRDPRATAGAERVNGPKLQKLFLNAERQGGAPAGLVSAIAFLESWGEANAQSPAGPRGIMQIASATARSMGLKIAYTRRYRVEKQTVQVRTRKGKLVTRTVRKRIPYTVLTRDDRMNPEKAVPAASRYLARLIAKYGSEDWAVFAYHCGEGCAEDVRSLKAGSVAGVFFSGSPAFQREVYQAIRYHMERDYSPTYWFRIMRARQLLEMHREDAAEFRRLAEYFRYRTDPSQRAPHRLAVWLTEQDLAFKDCEDLKREQGRSLARVFDNPAFFGFRLRTDEIPARDLANRDYYLQASPAAIGTLSYIAYETRRLHEAMRVREDYVPLDVVSLVRPLNELEPADNGRNGRSEALAHCTGQVFDLNISRLPAGQREALRFVLDDLGWSGYLGFVEESPNSGTLHIGSSPGSRDFFTKVFEEAAAASSRAN